MEVRLKAGDSLNIPEGCKAVIKDNVVVFEREEKEEVQEFKDGDVLTSIAGVVLIFKRDDGCDQFTSHYNTGNFLNNSWQKPHFRHATEEEKQTLFDKMKEEGLQWNAEKKRVEKIRWRAKEGEEYFFIDTDLQVCALFENNETCDDAFYNALNYFRTKEQAEEAARRMKKVLSKYHEEIGE